MRAPGEGDPDSRPAQLEGICYLGADEIARQGTELLHPGYDLSPGVDYGRILWVKVGRESAMLLECLEALSQECADGIEAIALLRRRARGFRGMEYFKLKIFQINTKETPSFLYNSAPSATPISDLSSVGNLSKAQISLDDRRIEVEASEG